MSKAQYNLTTKTDYLNRKMFLDPAGPVTIQRFEEFKYPKQNLGSPFTPHEQNISAPKSKVPTESMQSSMHWKNISTSTDLQVL